MRVFLDLVTNADDDSSGNSQPMEWEDFLLTFSFQELRQTGWVMILEGLGSNRKQAMVYGYDQLHRIVKARSLSEYGSNGYAERAPGANKYDVDYSYDENEDRALRIAPVEQFSESLSRESGGRYAGEVNFTKTG